MHATSVPRRRARSSIAVGAVALALALAGCSSSDDTATTTTTAATPSGTGTTPGTTAISDEERLAEAKTVAVGYFQAQAINDYGKARERSGGAASLVIDWAEAVNSIKAAESSGYQVPSVSSPNVRVQIDALTAGPDDTWTGTGFIELSFRPGPVASTTTTTSATPESTEPRSPSTYVVDLTFEGDGDAMRLVDYRLDDLPYPVSQLFVAFETPTEEAGTLSGTTVLGHRDLDGSVQYVVQVEAGDEGEPGPLRAVFTPAPEGTPPGTAVLPVGPDSIEATTFADPLAAGASGAVLAVLPGAFPGTAGTLTLATAGVDPTTTTTAGAPATTLSWALPEWPELTPRPVDTVEEPTSSTSTSTTSTSTTSTTTTTDSTPSTTAPTTSAPTTTRPSTTTSSSSTTTTTDNP
jgi:hypothetical protein